MREEDFIFSLYPNDLVYVEHKSGLKFTLQNADSTLEKTRTQTSAFAYFVSGSISTASITIRTHDNAYGIPSLGVKTLKTFHKYQVDVLGNVFPVHKETAGRNSADSSKKEAVMSYRCVIVSNPAHISTRSEQLVVETDERHTVPSRTSAR